MGAGVGAGLAQLLFLTAWPAELPSMGSGGHPQMSFMAWEKLNFDSNQSLPLGYQIKCELLCHRFWSLFSNYMGLDVLTGLGT